MLQSNETIGQTTNNRRTAGELYFAGLPESEGTFFNRSGNVVASTTYTASTESDLGESQGEVETGASLDDVVTNGNSESEPASNGESTGIVDIASNGENNPSISEESTIDLSPLVDETITPSALDIEFSATSVSAVPEPETYMMLAVGLAVVSLQKRKWH